MSPSSTNLIAGWSPVLFICIIPSTSNFSPGATVPIPTLPPNGLSDKSQLAVAGPLVTCMPILDPLSTCANSILVELVACGCSFITA